MHLRLSERTAHWVGRSRLLVLVVAVVALAILAPQTNPASLSIPVTGLLIAVAAAQLLDGEDRQIAVALYCVAIAARLSALDVLVTFVPGYPAGVLLSPDGRTYDAGSTALMNTGFSVGSPYTFFQTYDVGHYYIFAIVREIYGRDLITLSLFNSALGSLTAVVLYAWGRGVIGAHAIWLALLAAMSPSFVLFATADLLKDPAVLLATAIAVYAVTAILGRRGWATLWAVAVAAMLLFLHATRLYVAAYLEIGVLAATAAGLLRPESRASVRSTFLIVLAAVAVSEFAASAAGMPTSPIAIRNQILHVSSTPAMQDEPPGETETAVVDASGAGGLRWEVLAAGMRAINIVRRVVGPFVWILPERLDLRYLVKADFDLYPDTVIWLLTLPMIAVGIALLLVETVKGSGAERAPLRFVAIFLVLYFAQYVAINLAYRHREDVLLFALAFVPSGLSFFRAHHRSLVFYVGYLGLVGVIAVADLALRTMLS